ncbi:hypothetical protein B0H14DRAFT_2577749 [Mycena olivaceomarginata]|nr:hypothetical protein B0H14DRAFT_2577749 [Mycena olivaceomarginata]
MFQACLSKLNTSTTITAAADGFVTLKVQNCTGKKFVTGKVTKNGNPSAHWDQMHRQEGEEPVPGVTQGPFHPVRQNHQWVWSLHCGIPRNTAAANPLPKATAPTAPKPQEATSKPATPPCAAARLGTPHVLNKHWCPMEDSAVLHACVPWRTALSSHACVPRRTALSSHVWLMLGITMLVLQALDCPVERLLFTILDIGILSKEHQLNKVFDGTNNYAVYRHLLTANAHPAVPLIVVTSSLQKKSPAPLCSQTTPMLRRCSSTSARTMEGCLVQYHILPVCMIQDWINKP